jgi:hypothetical protein
VDQEILPDDSHRNASLRTSRGTADGLYRPPGDAQKLRHRRGRGAGGPPRQLGRPHNVEIIFNRRIRKDTKGTFRTAIDRRDNGGVVVNVFYKHPRIKQYLKDGRAMRIETPHSTHRVTWAATPDCRTWTTYRPKPVRSTAGYWMLNVSARAVSSRVQPLSGSRTPP